jgi:hypothetical protein
MPQSLSLVWSNDTCEMLENDTQCYNRDQAFNADMGATDPRTNGPWRTQQWQQPPLPEVMVAPETWRYLGEPYESEASVIAAWQAVMDVDIPEDGLPPNPGPPMYGQPEEPPPEL